MSFWKSSCKRFWRLVRRSGDEPVYASTVVVSTLGEVRFGSVFRPQFDVLPPPDLREVFPQITPAMIEAGDDVAARTDWEMGEQAERDLAICEIFDAMEKARDK